MTRDFETLYIVSSDSTIAGVDVFTSVAAAENRVRELYEAREAGDDTDFYITDSLRCCQSLLRLAAESVLAEMHYLSTRIIVCGVHSQHYRIVELAQMLDVLCEQHAINRQSEHV